MTATDSKSHNAPKPAGRARRVLYVAYPLLTVSEESAGGAEQMLWTLEREISASGVLTTVAASAGSTVCGELFSTGQPCTQPDDFDRRNQEHQERVLELVRQRERESRPFDLIHDKSGSFWTRAAEIDVPVLATLHLPRHFYPAHFFAGVPDTVSFNCVSESQARSFVDLKQMAGVVPNGIALDRFHCNHGPRHGLLWLGRVCEEKAPHLALEIAARAGYPITLAGQIYPFSYHQEYFKRKVEPRLRPTANTKWVNSPSAEVKSALLREAFALLITTQVDETSSLVAMEAAASGTPVIAFRRGALPEIVSEGVTGFLVESVEQAFSSLHQLNEIQSQECAHHARGNFNSAKMAEAYVSLYERMLSGERTCSMLNVL